MQIFSDEDFDYTNAWIAAAVWLSIIIVYTLTQAATVSLWDCGEFIAASSILGVPHPPGTPYYVLVGRLFTLIPIFEDISARINFLSGLCNSIAAIFGYLSAIRLLRPWLDKKGDIFGRIVMYAGAAGGAFCLAFGRTSWSNAIEAEVYGMSMLIMFAIVWLVLIFNEKRGTATADKIMITIVYLAFLGIGVHMATFIIMPIAAIVLILKKETPKGYWFILSAYFIIELFLIFALSSRPGEVSYVVPIIIGFAFYLFYVLSFEVIPKQLVWLGTGLALACLPIAGILRPILEPVTNLIGLIALAGTVGYSCYLIFSNLKNRSTGSSHNHLLTGAIFPIVSALLAGLIITGMHGYGVFLFLTVGLAVCLSLFIWKYIDLPILFAIGGSSLVILGVRPFVLGVIFAAVAVLVAGLGFKMPRWRPALMILLVAVMGFSVHAFIPIRSAEQPYINENNPSKDLTTTINFIERKQYGSQGMIERMFERRSEWENQFGAHRRMGLWGFFQEQYGLVGPKFLIMFVVGLFGIWEIVRRRSEDGLFIMLLFLVTTVGLVLYMNFADGTRINAQTGRDYLEVRDRDYFFTPGFMLFGLCIGIGIAAIIQFIRDSVKGFSMGPKKIVLGASLALTLLPLYTVLGNWYYCDRSNNYVAFDYASNMLRSADPNAVLFTGGDNDTFPVWCLQEAYRFRKDVRNVNLSLANTKWYIKQIQTSMGLNLGWTEADIDALRAYRTQDGKTFRLADQVVDALIENNPGVPINFSITTTASARKYKGSSIDSKLVLSGMKFRYDPEGTHMRVAIKETWDYYNDSTLFRYDRLADTTIYRNETTRRVIANVANGLIMSADGLYQSEMYDEASTLINRALVLYPTSGAAIRALARMYAGRQMFDSIFALIEKYPHANPNDIRLALARGYRSVDRVEEAFNELNNILIASPRYKPALDEMMRLLVKAKDVDAMVNVIRRWVISNPDDEKMRKALNDLIVELNRVQTEESGN